jgi:hypothetical protein
MHVPHLDQSQPLAPYICLICPSTVLISTLSDFYNWNRVYVRYCDGASFSGDAEGRAQVIFWNPAPTSLFWLLEVMMFYWS